MIKKMITFASALLLLSISSLSMADNLDHFVFYVQNDTDMTITNIRYDLDYYSISGHEAVSDQYTGSISPNPAGKIPTDVKVTSNKLIDNADDSWARVTSVSYTDSSGRQQEYSFVDPCEPEENQTLVLQAAFQDNHLVLHCRVVSSKK